MVPEPEMLLPKPQFQSAAWAGVPARLKVKAASRGAANNARGRRRLRVGRFMAGSLPGGAGGRAGVFVCWQNFAGRDNGFGFTDIVIGRDRGSFPSRDY